MRQLVVLLLVFRVGRFLELPSNGKIKVKPYTDYTSRICDNNMNSMYETINTLNENFGEYWKRQAQKRLTKHLNVANNQNKARNVIMFLGDGMSMPTLSAARVYTAQQRGYENGEEYQLEFEKFPVTGLAKTYCLDYQVPDSACTSTAYLGGVKSRFGTIGVDGLVWRGDCEGSRNSSRHVESIAKWAIDNGKSAGIVTTARVTHASPAGSYAHVSERHWETDTDVADDNMDPTVCRDIAHQLIHEDPGKYFKVILGGGRRSFRSVNIEDEERGHGARSDGRNLIDEWKLERFMDRVNSTYVWNREQLKNIDNSTEYLLGLFEGKHMKYNLEADPTTEPTLVEMVETAVKILSKNTNGYFLFVEGGRIDHAHHSTRSHLALDETKVFSEAVGKAVEMTDHVDTLIVVTADHSHVMTHNGYPLRGTDVLGPSGDKGDDHVSYTVLSYGNGPGYRKARKGKRVDVTKEHMANPRFRYPAMVDLESETHGGDDVAVFAYGPQQHIFAGLYEQNLIPHLLGYASCMGPGRTLCNQNQ